MDEQDIQVWKKIILSFKESESACHKMISF